jgi:hypothetical protein
MRDGIRGYKNGIVAVALAGTYAGLVLVLGVVSMVILLMVQDPILLSAFALAVVTFPLGWLIWWGWDFVPPQLENPLLLIVALSVAGVFQAWLLWRLWRGPSLREINRS